MYIYNICYFLLIIFLGRSSARLCTPSVTTCSGTHAPQSFCAGDLIFEDNFEDLDFKKWQHEHTLAGGGGWEFQWYTNNRSNSFTENGFLHIKPTLTADQYGEKSLSTMTLDIRGGNPAGECTNGNHDGCLRIGTPTSIINPIKSARLRTVHSFNFKYGKIEIVAKLPAGDWLWPALWLLPETQAYGTHPASGEVDLMESRGNRHLFVNGKNIGAEQIGTTLHWGPDSSHNAWRKSHFELNTPEGEGFDTAFHNYMMIWTPDKIDFYLDHELLGSVQPNTSFWDFGEFNKTGVENPWKHATKMAPFDQQFYIVMNLAVGGISGYFPDNAVNVPPKPWKNKLPEARTDFWNGRAGWLPTWKMDENNGESSSFLVDYVRVWAL